MATGWDSGAPIGQDSQGCDACQENLAPDSGRRRGWTVALILGAALLIVSGWVLYAQLTNKPLLPGRAETMLVATDGLCPTPTRYVRHRAPRQVSALLSEATVYDHDELADLACGKWYASDSGVQASEGYLTLTGDGQWDVWWGTTRTFEQGDAVLVLFQYNPGSEYELHLERGRWGTSSYQRWALHISHRLEMSIWDRQAPLRFAQMGDALTPQPGAWYYALLAISEDAEFVAQVWPQEAASPYLTYRQQMGLPWAGGGWVLGAGANRGQALLGSVTEITFVKVNSPSEVDTRFWEGLGAFERGEFSAALEAFEAALDLAPDQASQHYYTGMTHWALAQPDTVLAHLTEASRLDPGNDEYLRQLARLYVSVMGDQAQALAAVARAMELAPYEARNYDVRGMILRDMPGQVEAALADFDRAISLAPTTPEIYRHRAETLNRVERYAEALQDGERCAQLQPGDGQCYLEQARSHVGLGDRPAAAAYRIYLDLPRQPGCEGCEREAEDFGAAHPASVAP
jgi:tetratricopeptide (TPR) repeat protein/predicted nucleic acid-binding Zn ribbon protein